MADNIIRCDFNSESVSGNNSLQAINTLKFAHGDFNNADWSKNDPTGMVISADGKEATLTSASGDLRPFFTASAITIEVGKTYAYGAEFEVLSGTITQRIIDVTGYGTGSAIIATSGRQVVIFTATATTGLARIGLGTGGNETIGVSVKISQPFLYEVATEASAPPRWINPGCLTYFSFANASTLQGDGRGQKGFTVTDINGTSLTTTQDLIGVVSGDSFSNDIGDFPDRTAGVYPGISLFTDGVSGRTLVTAESIFGDTVALTGFPTDDIRQSFAVIQGGTNDVLGSETLVNMQTAVTSMYNIAKSAGLKPIMTTVAPSSTFSAPQKAVRTSYNDWLIGTFGPEKDVAVWDIDSITKDPADNQQLLPTYDSGDAVHLNSTGLVTISAGLAGIIRTTLQVSGVSGSSLTGPLTSSLTN